MSSNSAFCPTLRSRKAEPPLPPRSWIMTTPVESIFNYKMELNISHLNQGKIKNLNIPILPISSLTFASKSYRPLLWCQYTKDFALDPGDLWPRPCDMGNVTSTWWFSFNGGSHLHGGSPCMMVLRYWLFQIWLFICWKRTRNWLKDKRPLCQGPNKLDFFLAMRQIIMPT